MKSFRKIFFSFISLLFAVIFITPTHSAAAYSAESSAPDISDEAVLPIPNTPPPGPVRLFSDRIDSEAVAAAEKIYRNFLMFDPEVYLLTPQGIMESCVWGFMTEAEVAYVAQKTNEIVASCTTDYEKIYAVMEYVAQNICYDYDYYYHNAYDYSELNLKAYDVLVNETTVCAGYAELTKVMLQLQGIPCVYVNAPNHAWNLAYDGTRWIFLDVTWVSGSRMEYGVKHKSDDLWMDWFDFTLEYANTDYNHLIEGLPITISDGILKAYPDHSIYKDIIIPPTIHTIDFYLDDCTGYTLYLPASVKYIGSYCFPYSVLDAVYYEGTLGQFKNIYIDNWGNNGIFSSDIYYSSYTPSPVITDHPKHEPYTLTNTPFTLSVSAVFTSEEPSYQWYRNTVFSNAGGTPIEGATEVTVEITEEDQGKYYYYAVVGSVSPAASIPVEIMAFDDELPTYMEKYSPDINCYVFEESDRVLFYGNGSLDYDIWLGSNMAFEFSEGITSITDEFLNEVQYYVAQYIVSPANPVYTTDSCGALIRKSDNTLLSFPGRSNISEYSIPQGIAHVAANAFEWADFDVLHIPGSLLSLSKGIGFPHLDTITVAEDNPNFYYDEYGALICSYDQTLIRYSGNWDFYEYPVPDGIVNIADNAFMYAFPLQHITFPETVEYIGDYAFWNCDWLESVTIPKSVTHIGPFAFYACYDLADIYFLGAAPEANASFEEYTTLHCFDSYPGWTDSAAYDPESGTWNDCPILVTIENILGVSTLSENDVFSAEADNMAQGSFIAVSAYDSHGKMLSYTQAAVYDTGNVYTAIAIPENTFEIRVYAFDSSYCPLQKVLFRRP